MEEDYLLVDESMIANTPEEAFLDLITYGQSFQRVDNSDHKSEVLAAADEYFSIQLEE